MGSIGCSHKSWLQFALHWLVYTTLFKESAQSNQQNLYPFQLAQPWILHSEKLCLTIFNPPARTLKITPKFENLSHVANLVFGDFKSYLCPVNFYAGGSSDSNFWNLKWAYHLVRLCSCSSNILTRTQSSNLTNSKYIIFEFVGIKQTYLESFRKYSKMREYYNTSDKLPAASMPFILLADSINATLITKMFLQNSKMNGTQFPVIYPFRQLFQVYSDHRSHSIWHEYWENEREGLLCLHYYYFNVPYLFGYCDIPKLSQVKPWNLEILSYGFTKSIWISLAIVAILLGVTLHFSHRTATALKVFVTIFSSLISPTPTVTQEMERSRLFILWLFMCTVLINCYTGLNASYMIKPPEEEIIPTISEAKRINYSLVFTNKFNFLTLRSFEHFLESHLKDISEDVRAVCYLIRNSAQKSPPTNSTRMLAFQENTLVITWWPSLFAIINEANQLIRTEHSQTQRHCYLGKKVIPQVESYNLFAPGHQKMSQNWQRMEEGGVIQYWHKEMDQLQLAKRVQERVKAISPTHMIYDFVDVGGALKMEGKVVTIFFLWELCLGVSLIFALMERIRVFINGF